jgi:hypothetical protein
MFVLTFYLVEHIFFTYVLHAFLHCIYVTMYRRYIWRLAVIGIARKESPVHIYYWNNWWLLQFSITTVGYGDMTPQGTSRAVLQPQTRLFYTVQAPLAASSSSPPSLAPFSWTL